MKGRQGFTPAQKQMMQLSRETLEGLRVTGMDHQTILVIILQILTMCILTVLSFVEVTTLLLAVPGVQFLLSEKFCQDPLEAFFGKQRYKGGRNDNPSVKEFVDNTVSLRVQGSAALEPFRGNCSRKRKSEPLHLDDNPLPKRKRSSKS